MGGINVVETLKHVPKWRKIINFGYAGSNNLPIGTEVRIFESKLYHPNVKYLEPAYICNCSLLDDNIVDCYTSNDFVIETNEKEPCVFDMELAYIMALGFKNVESIKIVSDNLSLKEYEKSLEN